MTDSFSAPTATLLDELKQWKISSPAKPTHILPKSTFEGPADRNYTLKNKQVRKFLQYEKQQLGLNVGFTDDAEPSTATKVARWFFARNGGAAGPLVYGETVAMGYGKKPSFICYEKRFSGVNAGWFDTPCFQWRLAGGPAGQKIDPNQYLAIYNDKAGEFLIFFDRNAAMGDIGWPSSQTWGEQLTDELVEYAKKAALKALLAAAA